MFYLKRQRCPCQKFYYIQENLDAFHSLSTAERSWMQNHRTVQCHRLSGLYQSLCTTFLELADAVECAIRECIAEGVLKDFLEKHRAEAKEMSIFEYDQEKHMRQEREEAWEDGRAAGVNEGIQLTKQILQLSHQGESPAEIARKCSITLEQVKKILE